jgi:Tol biopolymer transport system component
VWSPDGTQIAYIGPTQTRDASGNLAGLNHVIAVGADGSGPRVVATAPRDTILVETRWAAAGRFVYQVSDLFSLRSVDPATSTVARLGTVGLTAGAEEAFTLSPDGRKAAFTAPCGCKFPQIYAVHVAPASGGQARSLPRPANATDYDPSFSPDGKQVAFVRTLFGKSAPKIDRNQSILVESVQGGPVRPLHVSGYLPAWSPNGQWIAFQRFTGQLEIVPAAGGKARVLIPRMSPAYGGAAFSWSPDSTKLVYTNGTRFGTVALTGQRTTFSLSGLRPDRNTPQWSPDGGSIAFTAVKKGADLDIRVYVIGADGSGLRRLA